MAVLNDPEDSSYNQDSSITHRSFVKSLSHDLRTQLTRKNNSSAVLRMSVYMLLLTGNSFLVLSNQFFIVPCLIVQGLLLISLFHLLHECVHDTVFTSRLMNRAVAAVCGLLLFLPSLWFRQFHFAHHRYTQHETKDPEQLSAKPVTLKQWVVHISGLPVYWSQFSLLIRSVFRTPTDSFLSTKHASAAQLEMRVMFATYAVLLIFSLISQSSVLLMLWLIPMLLGQPFLRLYLLAEHADCADSANMLENTRTVLTNPVVRWFTWNMPYHTEHHSFPAVPFHQLPRLHQLMQPYLREQADGYVEFNKNYLLSKQR